MSESVRHRFAEDSEDELEAGSDEIKPLSASASQTIMRTRLPMHIISHHSTDHEEGMQSRCLGDTRRSNVAVAFCLLLVLPLLFYAFSYRQNGFVLPSSYPSDKLQCAHDLNISFSDLQRQITETKKYNFCKNDAILCNCNNPLQPIAHVPMSPEYAPKWDVTFRRNIKLAATAKSPTVVFYGDSITEHMVGTDMCDVDQETMSVKQQFDMVFEGKALALGLAGDRCPQLFFRLQHGELPVSLNPPVIWILIGTNDQMENCSRETILMGIVNIAQYLQDQRPHARIVLNGILPKPHPVTREWNGTANYAFITWINERLACYATGIDAVEYYDASPIFLDEKGTVPEDLMPDGLHPSGKGTRLWTEDIMKRVKVMVSD